MLSQAFALMLMLNLMSPPVPAAAQARTHFYNVDRELTIKGRIQTISMEPRYEGAAPFVVVILETDESVIYTVELSPAWFFEQDLHRGEGLTIVGSLFETGTGKNNVIAREIRFRGQTLVLRDKYGFPNWRGGQKNMRRKRIKK